MSKTIYYLGAGASFGKRNRSGTIIQGLPVVNEIPSQIDTFRDTIANMPIPEDGLMFLDSYEFDSRSIEMGKMRLLEDIDELKDRIREHSTIDTYARKLYLTGDNHSFEKLKDVLCAFFIWEHLEHKTDNRYDTFLANVLEASTLSLPREISIISWNYDSQLEIAYNAYSARQSLAVFEKNIQGRWPSNLPETGRVFKVNGSATFVDFSVITYLVEKASVFQLPHLIQFYSSVRSDTSQTGIQFKTHLSFAWEDSINQGNMMHAIEQTVTDAEQVVVIGYSFPFFNRETDRTIFKRMHNLKKIYVQDLHPETVESSIAAVLPPNNQIKVVPILDCTQFYLPAEL